MKERRMNFHILTLFPEMVMDGLNTSIIGRAIEAGLLEINAVNIRDYSTNKHMKVDDYPYGGGAGLVMQPERKLCLDRCNFRYFLYSGGYYDCFYL